MALSSVFLVDLYMAACHDYTQPRLVCRWSGSMRGAVSVALVYHFFDFTDKSEHVASIIGMTIIVVVFSTMVFGAATKPLLDVMLGKQGN